VATHGGIAAADPHRLVLMLMDGALERLAKARGCLERGDIAGKAGLLHRTVGIIAELRASLDLGNGGPLAGNLDALYDYLERLLVRANIDNRTAQIDEAARLINEIRGAWVAIQAQR
jgi:flagellar protein FliS